MRTQRGAHTLSPPQSYDTVSTRIPNVLNVARSTDPLPVARLASPPDAGQARPSRRPSVMPTSQKGEDEGHTICPYLLADGGRQPLNLRLPARVHHRVSRQKGGSTLESEGQCCAQSFSEETGEMWACTWQHDACLNTKSKTCSER